MSLYVDLRGHMPVKINEEKNMRKWLNIVCGSIYATEIIINLLNYKFHLNRNS